MPNRRYSGLFILLIVLLFRSGGQAGPANLDAAGATAFLRGLSTHPDSLDMFLDADDLRIAERLDIEYPEAPCKPLISWDLPPGDRDNRDFRFAIEELDDRHSRLTLLEEDSTATRDWIFRNGKVVSSILYQVRDWKQIDSPHFRFFVSDTTLFHPANIEALENFLSDTALRLGMTDADLERLAREKIYYCFCRDQDEIRELTGFFARGMYVVSHDIVVSTYSAHFHELAHLLMNFKLKRPHLYTHPLFLEGFAVAVGGRGGKTPDILHQLGVSVLRQGWVSVAELLDAQGFYGVNASMSYPGSGVYIRFLLEQLGDEDFLDLYAGHGGDVRSAMSMVIDPGLLPDQAVWKKYLEDHADTGTIEPGAPGLDTTAGPVAFHPLGSQTHFGFAVPDTLLVFEGTSPPGYQSFLFEEFFPESIYGGHRYFIRASSAEAAIYDLFTNNMVALYAAGFSADATEVPFDDGLYWFRVDRSVFRRPPAKE